MDVIKLARYILTRRVYNTLIGRGYKLVCKICECELKIAKCPKCNSENIVVFNEEYYLCKNCNHKDLMCSLNGCVESKPSKYRRRKFYHCDCYDGSFMEIEDDGNDESE